jgi:hypothetical protein
MPEPVLPIGTPFGAVPAPALRCGWRRDGDLRKLLQIVRKQALLDLLGENGIELPIIYSEHLTGEGQKMFEYAAKLNLEGIISKNAQAPYRSERCAIEARPERKSIFVHSIVRQ